MQTTRTVRLAHDFQQEIATILHRELKDPRLGFVTVTRVELTKDLRHAKVFFSCLGGPEERARSQEALDHSVKFIYGLLKKRFHLKALPELVFHYDESITESIELSNVFERLKQPPSSGEENR